MPKDAYLTGATAGPSARLPLPQAVSCIHAPIRPVRCAAPFGPIGNAPC